jgi:putative protease
VTGAVCPANPKILAPAGNRAAFLAALAAGADAVYCGLKQFSARMEAKNFQLEELAQLTALAHKKGIQVYVTLNTLFKPAETQALFELLTALSQQVAPDALIIQDLGMMPLARQAGFKGELHLSTLANVSFPAALDLIHDKLPVRRVVLPRELSIDEIKQMAAQCPSGLSLETFIHGALCYAVSGRCYWSSFLGGKSGLRGRCVQPCRRLYRQTHQRQRLFSCQDLSLDVLVKVLAGVPQVTTWKIEGRKKGPHYVYYTVSAYRLLRDHGRDPKEKKAALALLEQALGRSGTHYRFLPQRPQNPVAQGRQTGSGLLAGKVFGGGREPYLSPRFELLKGDQLRVGYEDDPWHRRLRIGRGVPKGGRLNLQVTRRRPPKGTPVFLVDRREKALDEILAGLEAQLEPPPPPARGRGRQRRLRQGRKSPAPFLEMHVHRRPPRGPVRGGLGLWLSQAALKKQSRPPGGLWWWLPPVIWPESEATWRDLVGQALKTRPAGLVLGAPWQLGLMKQGGRPSLWAGPFCNVANPFAVETLRQMGFQGAFVSPELGQSDYLQLAAESPLPLGIVVKGLWPLAIARPLPEALDAGNPFFSPREEAAWAVAHGDSHWLFPNWELDLSAHQVQLRKAGYQIFVHLHEPVPQSIRLKKRPGLWNWQHGLA